MMSDDFIESVITPETEQTNEKMNREFYGMEAVAKFDERLTEDFGRAREKMKNGGDD